MGPKGGVSAADDAVAADADAVAKVEPVSRGHENAGAEVEYWLKGGDCIRLDDRVEHVQAQDGRKGPDTNSVPAAEHVEGADAHVLTDFQVADLREEVQRADARV